VNDQSLEIIFDKPKMRELQEAIMKVKAGNGDFSIGDGNDNNILFFWWNREK
jgi:hypothetical protein